MPRTKGAKNKPKPTPFDYVPPKNPVGRPKKEQPKPKRQKRTPEEIAADKAKREERQKELTLKYAAELMAKETEAEETAALRKDVAAAQARWKIDRAKLATHNQYVMLIATMPPIDYNDPMAVKDRVQDYLDIAAAAGQRVVFETIALALGMNRVTLRARCNGNIKLSGELRAVYDWIKAIADSSLAEYAHSGESNAIASIFYARNNQGYTNEDPQVVPEDSSTSEQTNEEIAQKYSDLPI